MLNKKGTSLVELLISIALLSIILAFMLKMLIDVNNSRTNNTFAKNNQLIRAEIIKNIQDDIKDKELISITSSGSDANTLVINFVFNGSTSKITATSSTLTYLNTNGETRKWTMKDATIYVNKASIGKEFPTRSDDKNYTILINIQVHTANDLNNVNRNNTLDDIQISIYNNNYSSISVPEYLGNNS